MFCCSSEPYKSYCFRFSTSVKIATALPTALNASAAPGARFLSNSYEKNFELFFDECFYEG